MRLVRVKLKNFRCYQVETEIHLNDLTAIIGKNDIGKSAILDAMDAFFNDAIDPSDLSANADSQVVSITCVFDGVPPEVILDTAVATSPRAEGILNPDEQLEIRKTVTFGKRKSTAVFLMGNQPNDERLGNLLSLKNTRLKNLAEQLEVNLDDIDKRKNPLIREIIRNAVGGERVLTELKVDGGVDAEDNLKTIWGSLKKLLPVYSLFKTDKSFDDKDGVIKDPLQAAIDEALALPDIKDLLAQIEERVKEFSTDVADRTIEKLKDIDESIAETLKSEFGKNPNYSKVFDLTLLNENDIPLNKRGSGVRRLVILSFFQAQAERRKIESDAPSIIYAIEEPEASQHPDHQKMVVNALTELSEQIDVQVLFTTHSGNLAREIPIGSLRFVSLNENAEVTIEYGRASNTQSDNEDVIEKIVRALGILPNPSETVRVLVYVEGNHDVNALKRYSKILSENDAEIINLGDTNRVGYVITGGSALKHYVEQKHLAGLGKAEVHIYDNDVAEHRAVVQRINEENDSRKIAFNTSKSELENYLHHLAIEESYAANGTLGVLLGPITDEIDVPIETAKKLHTLAEEEWEDLDNESKKDRANGKKKGIISQSAEIS